MAAPEGVGTNQAGRMSGLSALCPIKLGTPDGQDRSFESLVRSVLAALPLDDESPMAAVPSTYLARLFVLKDVFYESTPAREEHLKSQYLMFMTNFHGEVDQYLWDMWDNVEPEIRSIWQHCVAFDKVTDANGFVRYMKDCQATNSLLLNGSTDEPLSEQLKGLYLKQEFGQFVAHHQGASAADLKKAFMGFIDRVEVDNLDRPTWKPGTARLSSVVVP